MDHAVASARGVVKRYGRDGPAALNGVDLTVLPGEMTGLVGPDGAGKTTLMRIIAGLIEPDAGKVLVDGQPALTADRNGLGYMPQRFGLYEDLSVIDNLRLYADIRALPLAEREERFARLLDVTSLAAFQQRLAGKLSGGMKQKLGLACALIREPRLLLLDEPAVGVDPISRAEIWDLVRELSGDGVGVLWSTSNLDEAERCDTVFLMREGELLYHGAPASLTEEMRGRTYRVTLPAATRRAALRHALDDPRVIDGTVHGNAIRLALAPGVAADAIGDMFGAGSGSGTPAEAAPRFEDAFIARLGGGPEGTSQLVKNYRQIPVGEGAAISASHLTKRFGDFTAARDVSFTVPQGQVFGLLGPNGAGKSTIFKMLCGLLTPSEGTCTIAGHDLRRARADARQSLGYMAQKFSLYGDLSVRQNLDFFAGAYGLANGEARAAIDQAVETLRLERYLRMNANALPLGLKQRLALGCALMHQPPVLFLDEPTSGVDPVVRREFWTHINGLVEKGVSVLVTTHYMEEAEYCDRIALIYNAEQIASGTPDELKRQAGTPDGTMDDAFIALIEAFDRARAQVAA